MVNVVVLRLDAVLCCTRTSAPIEKSKHSPLSTMLLHLATVVGHSGRTSIQHMYEVCIMKRCLYGIARKLWSTRACSDRIASESLPVARPCSAAIAMMI
jgi:hypothetical protein